MPNVKKIAKTLRGLSAWLLRGGGLDEVGKELQGVLKDLGIQSDEIYEESERMLDVRIDFHTAAA